MDGKLLTPRVTKARPTTGGNAVLKETKLMTLCLVKSHSLKSGSIWEWYREKLEDGRWLIGPFQNRSVNASRQLPSP